MTDSSCVDDDLVSPAPTAASILGIKGPLRFRPHGSSQKAHVVLRRVDPESDSEGEGEIKGVIQFSLFAYKRIEVKPGKEILLTVADGPFKDRAIIFEGDDLEGSSLSDVEDGTQVAEDDDTLVPPEPSLPLKMRKPWAKRREASVPLAHLPPSRVTYHSTGVQTDPANVAGSIIPTLTDPSPAPQQSVFPAPTLARGVSKSSPPKPVGISVSSSSLSDVRAGSPPVAKTAASKMGVTQPRDVELDRSLSHVIVDPTANNSLTSSVEERCPTSSAPVNQDDISTPTSIDAVNDKLGRWSPSVPVPMALPVMARPADESSDSARSSSVSEDEDLPLAIPERPWSPSVPAALTTQATRRHNIRVRREEQLEDVNSARETQPSLRREVPPPLGPPTPALQNSPFLAKTKPPSPPQSNSFAFGGFVSDVVGLPSSSFSDEDSKTDVLSENISSRPSSVRRYSRPHAILPPPHPAEVPSSPSTHAHPPSPSRRKDQSPPRRSPASSRSSFSHGPLDNSAASVPSHPPSPTQSMRKPQTLSWPPFRPGSGRDDGPSDFYPPFRASPDSCEPSPPLSLRPPSGTAAIHDHAPLNVPARGRPTVISSSNSIPIAPRHSSFPFSSTPGRPPSPAAQTFHHSQSFAQPITPKAPLKPPQIPDGGHPPRQPRSGLPLQAMASAPLGQGIPPKAYPQYHRHQRHPHAPRSIADGRGHNIPMAAGTKRRASPPRMDPLVSLEIPPRRPPPSTWPTVSPIRCVTVQGERVAIQGITFNRTGKLMAVTCTDCTIRVWDNVMYSEVARLPHSSTVVSAQWMDDDAGVLALCMDGALVRWTRPAGSTPPRAHDIWHWDRLLDPVAGATPEDAPTALAYKGDRIAASFPKFGVRIWMMKKGSWQPQRPIDRQNVTSIEFVDDGTALLGGTKDGVLWYCQVFDPALRMYNVFKARICGIDVPPSGTHALVSQQVGRAHLVAISHDDNRGKVMQVYTVEPDLQADAVYDANAMFVGRHDAVLYGSARGYLFAWDKTSARILCGMDHGEGGCIVQAIGAYRRGGPTGESLVVTGSQDGRLNWWAEPVGPASMDGLPSGKRVKTS